MRKPNFGYAKTKADISFAVTAKLNSTFVFATRIVQFLQNFKSLGFFCDCTGQFVSDQVGDPENRFSHVPAHIFTPHCTDTTKEA